MSREKDVEEVLKSFGVKESFPVDRPHQIKDFGPTRTVQSMAEGNSVADIVRRYQLTGTLPQSMVVPQYIDTTKLPSLMESLNIGAQFSSYFSGLPSAVRREFFNDPKELMNAIQDPKKKDRLTDLGIFPKPGVVAPVLGTKENPIFTSAPPVVEPPPGPPAPPLGNGGQGA